MKMTETLQLKIKAIQRKKALNNIKQLEEDLKASQNGQAISKIQVPGWLFGMMVAFSIILGLFCSFIWQAYRP